MLLALRAFSGDLAPAQPRVRGLRRGQLHLQREPPLEQESARWGIPAAWRGSAIGWALEMRFVAWLTFEKWQVGEMIMRGMIKKARYAESLVTSSVH